MEGGFPMGPFELMDLVGVDTGFEVSKSFYAQSFGEPRWRPSPITARYVAAGRYGRKSGRGYYDYSGGAGRTPRRGPRARSRRSRARGEGVVVIAGAGALADELRAAAAQAGYEVRSPHAPSGGVLPSLVDRLRPRRAPDAGWREPAPIAEGALRAGHRRRAPAAVRARLAARARPRRQRGRLPRARRRWARRGIVELTRSESSSPVAAARAERFFGDARQARRVGRRRARAWCSGGSSARSSTRPPSRSAKASASARDIDLGMVLGLSHPRGPLEWADAIGLDHVLAVLEALCDEYREERYRPAPALRGWRRRGALGRASRRRLLRLRALSAAAPARRRAISRSGRRRGVIWGT